MVDRGPNRAKARARLIAAVAAMSSWLKADSVSFSVLV